MSESKTNGNGETSEKGTRVPVVIKEYDNREECEENRPAGADAEAWKVYECKRPNDKVCYIWAVGSVNALSVLAKTDGYAVSLGTARGPRQMKPSTMLEVLKGKSDEELRAEGYSDALIVALRGTTPAPTPTESTTTPTPKKPKGKPSHLATH